MWRYMKLFRATQLHMLGLEIVSHYVALIYEIRSHFIYLFFNKSYEIVSHFILTCTNQLAAHGSWDNDL